MSAATDQLHLRTCLCIARNDAARLADDYDSLLQRLTDPDEQAMVRAFWAAADEQAHQLRLLEAKHALNAASEPRREGDHTTEDQHPGAGSTD